MNTMWCIFQYCIEEAVHLVRLLLRLGNLVTLEL